MLPIVHAFAGIALSGFLMPFIGIFNALVIVFATIFIDFDHYYYWMIYHGKFTLRENFDYHKNDLARDELHIFHTFEFWIVLLIGSIYFDVWFFAAIGIFFHLLLDFLEIGTQKRYDRRAISVFAWMYRRLRKDL